ncbi:MAG: RiPP maturation radical SAM protein 1 [Bacteroidales bacterium]|nr:RiPP maturation radical SAM protein 1 [Bacteroidales bacterium]
MPINKENKILIVIPPFTLLESPSLGVHSLQKVAKENGFNVNVLYSDQLFAKHIGVDKYKIIANELMSPYEQIPERLFAHFAYENFPYMGKNTNANGINYLSCRSDNNFKNLSWQDLLELKHLINSWLDELVDSVLKQNPKVVGLSSSHQQTNASIAIINRIKKSNSDIITILGGSNCDGKMSLGIESLSSNIDFIFSGESEQTFLNFLIDLENNKLPTKKIITGIKLLDVNQLPLPDYYEYYHQLNNNNILPANETWITYESSRGCWWGQNNLCTFCGVNGNATKYRSKKFSKVLSELTEYVSNYPTKNIRMVDVLMPRNYLKTLLPEVAVQLPDVSFFYEQRADMSLNEMITLKKAGVEYMQIGIESFSNSQLIKLNKGTTVKDNIDILRYAKSLGIVIGWNMLTEIPNDTFSEWENIDKILPLITHLNPPIFFRPIEITRFSPYFNNLIEFGISNLKPLNVYYDIFPEKANVYDLAWLYTGDYDCNSRQNIEIQESIRSKVKSWIKLWEGSIENIPALEVHRYGKDKYILRDTRSLEKNNRISFINTKQVSVALLGDLSEYLEEYKDWALQNNLLISIDGKFLAISTSNQTIFNEFLGQ